MASTARSDAIAGQFKRALGSSAQGAHRPFVKGGIGGASDPIPSVAHLPQTVADLQTVSLVPQGEPKPGGDANSTLQPAPPAV